MPSGRVKWFSLEKGFGFISNDEGEDVSLSVSIVEAPPSISGSSRGKNDDLAAMIEDTIKILDRYSNSLRSGRSSSATEAERLAKVLRGIASQIEGN